MAAERVKSMDAAMSGTALSLVKRHIYASVLLALRCLHRWQQREREGGAAGSLGGSTAGPPQLVLAKAQAKAFDSLVCQLSRMQAVPSSMKKQANAILRALHDD